MLSRASVEPYKTVLITVGDFYNSENELHAFAVAKKVLEHHPKWTIYLAGKCEISINACLEGDTTLQKCQVLTLDLDNIESIQKVKHFLVRAHPRGIDILIHARDNQPMPLTLDVGSIFQQCFWSVWNLVQQLSPLVKPLGRIVIASSRFSQIAYRKLSEDVQQKFQQCQRIEDVAKLMAEIGQRLQSNGADDDETDEHLLSLLRYGVAKLGVNLLVELVQRKFNHYNMRILVNCYCSGPCNLHDEAQQADSPYFLSDLPNESSIQGKFIAERKVLDKFIMSDKELEYFLKE